MQHTFHIHIMGLVQGVGFRPFVCKLAAEMDINGWVNNTTDGVHIEFTANRNLATVFYNQITTHHPVNAVITKHFIKEVACKTYKEFSIKQSSVHNKTDILLTPDIAICEECKHEIQSVENKRYHYPFTTCLNCGPRYSITNSLPYDRENTTMDYLKMCDACVNEYSNIYNRRHYSQTNSCKDCSIQMHLYSSKEKEVICSDGEKINRLIQYLQEGKILSVKGIGGYLLLCDATNESTVLKLRERKQRPSKPLALLYATIEMADADVHLQNCEIEALKSKSAPIVLCNAKAFSGNNICTEAIALGLDKIGVMLPYTPLLYLIAEQFGKPLVATSANISGSPIIYKDEEALDNLFDVADYILTYDRAIVTPQDDSVLQFTKNEQKIILRRSRGLAPNYFPKPFESLNENILATGGELKSAFAFQQKNNLYISQFLGDQSTIESQDAFEHTLQHFISLLNTQPQKIIVDKHPAYSVSYLGKEFSIKNNIECIEVQHHQAHVGAVLAENNLLNSCNPILGFAWDGTGYGDDAHIWGSELFVYHEYAMKRIGHLSYFSQLVGDKMSKEPRLSALSLLKEFPAGHAYVQKYFSKTEWQYYQKLLQKDSQLQTSSLGRFLDGLACILGIRMYNSHEGEAAMQMEALARNAAFTTHEFYDLSYVNGTINWHHFMHQFLEDIHQKKDVGMIAWKVFYSLAKLISSISDYLGIQKLAFSGGVFQNALLVDLIIDELAGRKELYFHKQLCPNDECIGFGQIACYYIQQQKDKLNFVNSVNYSNEILS